MSELITTVIENRSAYIEAVQLTLIASILSILLALVLGLIIAVLHSSPVKVVRLFTRTYISFFRGTPLLVQLFLLYYGLPQLFPIFVGMDAFTAAIIGLTLHFAAYMAESIRAAILGIHKSQMEAALSIGMSRYQAMQRIILPQAARIATPSLMNYFIDMIKSTSLAFTLGVAEIMGKAQMEASSSFKFFESFMAVALIYWVVVIFFTRLQHLLEVRLNRAY
jgi:putative amino-acid transport system permease protein